MNKCIYIIGLICIYTSLWAQQPILNGKITYEKVLNVHKVLKERLEDYPEQEAWINESLRSLPKYKTDIFQLTFSPKQTLFSTIQEDENPRLQWYKTITNLSQKTVFTSDSTWANRTVYDKTYLVSDSIMKPVWKLTGEYREIAGYNCRRATTILYDSVYVIAFFTEFIPVPGGPDLFAGLPGMILGVVIPRMNITIFATKVETFATSESDFVFKTPKKPIRVNRDLYYKDLLLNTEQWGKYGTKFAFKALF